jgi:GH24 family phage-related lysozyme (muramidase)
VDTDAKWILQWEGSVNHLYLDSSRLVTIGVGNMLPSAQTCVALPLVDRIALKSASPQEKLDEYRRVSELPSGYAASWYGQFTHLVLPQVEIERLFEARITEFRNQLQVAIHGYASVPHQARLALLDMAFNLGVAGLMRFHRLIIAVRNHSWELASMESHRSGVRESRNKATAALFLSLAPIQT